MPELPKGLEEQILEDIRNRDDISSANLPSAIFYTFVNTHQALNCAGFSRTAAYVAGVRPGSCFISTFVLLITVLNHCHEQYFGFNTARDRAI